MTVGGIDLILEPVVGMPAVILFGGGHVSRFVSRSAAMAGFRVTVVDDRRAYANPERFPEAEATIALPFEKSWEQVRILPTTSIVIVTRGHKFDEVVLERALSTPARYIGMIGSRTKVLATFSHLRERGITDDLLSRVRAPIGLDLGAVSAEEIGISITAELVAMRRGKSGAVEPMAHRLGGSQS
jgi:xanthine dehydrogenase accessory factor